MRYAGSALIELPIAHLAPAEDPVMVAALITATHGLNAASPTTAAARADGMRVRREVAGDAWVDRAVDATTDSTRRLPGLHHPVRLGDDLDAPRASIAAAAR